MWKGSVSDCLSHLHEKHGGSQYVVMKNLGKFFPPWTYPGICSRRPFVRYSCGCPVVSRGRMSVGTQLSCV